MAIAQILCALIFPEGRNKIVSCARALVFCIWSEEFCAGATKSELHPANAKTTVKLRVIKVLFASVLLYALNHCCAYEYINVEIHR